MSDERHRMHKDMIRIEQLRGRVLPVGGSAADADQLINAAVSASQRSTLTLDEAWSRVWDGYLSTGQVPSGE